MTVTEAAAELGVSPSLVRKEVRAGRMGCHRYGAKIVIEPDDLADYREACRRPASAGQGRAAPRRLPPTPPAPWERPATKARRGGVGPGV